MIIDTLKRINIDVEWLHFGSGPQFDEISKQAHTLPGNIRFKLLGYKPMKDIVEYYKNNAVNLFINLSDSEGLPFAILDAMSFGIPILARNVGCIADALNEHTGILLPDRVLPEQIANEIINFKNSYKNTPDFRKKVRKYWESYFLNHT